MANRKPQPLTRLTLLPTGSSAPTIRGMMSSAVAAVAVRIVSNNCTSMMSKTYFPLPPRREATGTKRPGRSAGTTSILRTPARGRVWSVKATDARDDAGAPLHVPARPRRAVRRGRGVLHSSVARRLSPRCARLRNLHSLQFRSDSFDPIARYAFICYGLPHFPTSQLPCLLRVLPPPRHAPLRRSIHSKFSRRACEMQSPRPHCKLPHGLAKWAYYQRHRRRQSRHARALFPSRLSSRTAVTSCGLPPHF